jgi:hypothetical protein
MAHIVVSSILDYVDPNFSSTSEQAELALNSLKSALDSQSPIEGQCDLEKIFVRFDIGVDGMPGWRDGIRLGNYMKKRKAINATIGVAKKQLSAIQTDDLRLFFVDLLLQLVNMLKKRYSGKLRIQLDSTVIMLKKLKSE